MTQPLQFDVIVSPEQSHKRLDQIASQMFPDYSRARIQGWIQTGDLLVDGKIRKNKDKLLGGERITLTATIEVADHFVPQKMDINVVYQDDDIIVIDKPMGMVVHPGAGLADGTLMNGLLYKFPELNQLPRAGIVHRLDKDTTGLMVVARTLQAHGHLIEQLQSRDMGREYEAVCTGVLTGGGMVDEPIARHSTQRTKMAVMPMGKEAVTHYRVLQKFQHHTHIRLKLETGRTHQIRVHMAYIHHPLVGDSTYAGRLRLPKGIDENLQQLLRTFPRQALHAAYLELVHPKTLDQMCFESPLPDDFVELLNVLAEDKKQADINYFRD